MPSSTRTQVLVPSVITWTEWPDAIRVSASKRSCAPTPLAGSPARPKLKATKQIFIVSSEQPLTDVVRCARDQHAATIQGASATRYACSRPELRLMPFQTSLSTGASRQVPHATARAAISARCQVTVATLRPKTSGATTTTVAYARDVLNATPAQTVRNK